MTDKPIEPILIGIGGLEAGVSASIARILAERCLTLEDVIILDATSCSREDIEIAFANGAGKTLIIEDVDKLLHNQNLRESVFKITATPRFEEPTITKKDLDGYHPFSKFTKDKRKKW